MTGIEIALTIAGAVALGAAIRSIVVAERSRRDSIVASLASQLEGSRVEGDAVVGRRGDRTFRIALGFEDGSHHALTSIEVEHGKPLVVRRAGPIEMWGRTIGLGGDHIGRIAANDLARAAKDFARERQEMTSALRALFDHHGARSLEANDGRLLLDCGPISNLAAPSQVRRLMACLDDLVRIANAYERSPIAVRVLGSQRLAWTGGEGHRPRCPYCHGEVSGEEPDLVACSSCGTVHHEGCFTEHGRCTVLGCESDRADRGRERA